MERARKEIIACDALLFDASEKSTGRAIESGIAFASNKKVTVILKKGTQIKDTLKGIADLIIEYDKLEDIIPGMKDSLNSWTNKQ